RVFFGAYCGSCTSTLYTPFTEQRSVSFDPKEVGPDILYCRRQRPSRGRRRPTCCHTFAFCSLSPLACSFEQQKFIVQPQQTTAASQRQSVTSRNEREIRRYRLKIFSTHKNRPIHSSCG
ncbi:unnamed protein product, partial [Ectocarpus sp. 8 AP-2014]